MINKLKLFLIFIFLAGFFSQKSLAAVQDYDLSLEQANSLIRSQVKDNYTYSGLASFYNSTSAFIVDVDSIKKINFNKITLAKNQHFAIVGHYKILILHKPGLTLSYDGVALHWSEVEKKNNTGHVIIQGKLLSKSDLDILSSSFKKLKYAHLWRPFQILCFGVERLLYWLNSIQIFGWIGAIALLSLLFKIFFIPIDILRIRSQRKISYIQATLSPDLKKIKENYSGEEAHKKFIALHKQQGISPFYMLRPSILVLIPIPLLIAIFNVLGEMDQVIDYSFLWIDDISRPDAVYNMKFHIPFLGSTINLLPILMTLLVVFTALLHKNKIITQQELKKQKINLYCMAFGFFILFYPFPAIMVLYWTFANIWQLIQQRFIRV